MATAPTINREWIASEFSKGIDAEHALQTDAEATSASPPDPDLGVLYHEIATADARHRLIVETIATRYGYTPSRSVGGGISGAIERIKDKVSEMGASPLHRLSHDLSAKANSIHWYTAWVATFQAIGDAESARELAAILTEEKSHHDALQEGLSRLVTRGATAVPAA